MRNITKIVVNKEELVRYDHDFTNGQLTVYVAKGTDDGLGNFIQDNSQSLDVYVITGTEYTALLGSIEGTNKIIGALTQTDLWTAIDATVARLSL